MKSKKREIFGSFISIGVLMSSLLLPSILYIERNVKQDTTIVENPKVSPETAPIDSTAIERRLLDGIRKVALEYAETGERWNARTIYNGFKLQADSIGITYDFVIDTFKSEIREARSKKSLWHYLGIGFVPLLIWTVFRKQIDEILSQLVNSVRSIIYNRVSGHPFFRRFALKNYKRALREKHQNIKIVFRPDQNLPLREVYVPLIFRGLNKLEQVDAKSMLDKYAKVMVIGPPGSGKTILLKQLSLSYAMNSLALKQEIIPILLELRRLNVFWFSVNMTKGLFELRWS